MDNFIRTFSELRKGKALEEAGDKLAALVKQCRLTGCKGQLTIKIDVTPCQDETLEIGDDISLKSPKPAKRPTVFYSTKDGFLTRDDPQQSELPLNVEPISAPQSQQANG